VKRRNEGGKDTEGNEKKQKGESNEIGKKVALTQPVMSRKIKNVRTE